MDAAVRSYERRRDGHTPPAEGVQSVNGVATLTRVVKTYSGRRNEETFAKEVCTLIDDAHVATGGDCGRLYVWGTQSGRLVYRAQGDGSIVNCVCPHPSLPLVAVSGIDDDIKLFGLGDARQATLLRSGPRKATQPEAARGGHGSGLFLVDADESEGWAADEDGPPPAQVSAEEARDALTEATQLREAGNDFYRRRKLYAALSKYEEALDALHVDTPDGEQQSELREERRKLWLNLAALGLASNQHTVAVGWCEFVLEDWPRDVKALYRRAQAHLKLGALSLAEEGLALALSIDGEDALLNKLMVQLKAAQAREEREEREERERPLSMGRSAFDDDPDEEEGEEEGEDGEGGEEDESDEEESDEEESDEDDDVSEEVETEEEGQGAGDELGAEASDDEEDMGEVERVL